MITQSGSALCQRHCNSSDRRTCRQGKSDQRRTIRRESEPAAPKGDAGKKTKKSESEGSGDKPKKPIVKYKKPKASESAKKADEEAKAEAPAENAEVSAPGRLWKKLKSRLKWQNPSRKQRKLKQLLQKLNRKLRIRRKSLLKNRKLPESGYIVSGNLQSVPITYQF